MSEQTNDAVFAMDNPDFDWPEAQQPEDQPEQEQAQPEKQPEHQQQVEQPQQPEQPQPKAEDNFGSVAQAIRESERARAEALAQQAYNQAWQEAQRAYQQQPAQPVEPPDPIIEPEAYREWVRQSVLAEVMPQVQSVQQQSAQMLYQQSLASAKALEPSFDKYLQAANGLCAQDPGLVDIIQRSDNPGLQIIKYGKMALALNGETVTAPQQATAPQITDAVRQQVLAEEAAKRAAAGQPPTITVPRGVGAAAPGAGMSDAIPPATEWHRLPPAELERVKQQVYGSNGGAL